MRIKKLKSVACMAALLLLFGVSMASAADREERLFSKQPGKSPVHMLQVGKRQGQGHGLQHFLKTLGGSACDSNCCWATANCDGADTECSSTRCDAWCADGSHSGTACNAT